jgi:hypothetical protein
MKQPAARSLGIAILGLFLFNSTVHAATWINGDGTWNDSSTANWSPSTVPTTNTAISLTQSSASAINITYAGNQVLGLTGTETVQGTRFGNLSLNNSGGGTTTLAVGTGDMLPVGNTATIGAGGKLDISGGTFTPYQHMNLQAGGQIVQTGGLIQPVLYDMNMSGGAYAISAGTTSVQKLMVNPSSGTATFGLTGGMLKIRTTSSDRIVLTPSGSGAVVFTHSGGTVDMPATLRIGANAAYNLSGTAILNGNQVSVTGGEFTQTGGTFSLQFDLTASSGQVTFDGAATTGLGNLNVGTATGNATATIENGAEVILSGNTAISVGGSTGSGSLTIDGATARGSTSGKDIAIGAGGAIVLQNSGFLGTVAKLFGDLTVNGGGSLTVNSGSEARFTYDSAINDGSVTINDGVYTARLLSIGTSGGSGVVTLNGGATTYSGTLTVGGATGSGLLALNGGTFVGGSGTTDHMIVNPAGTIRGHATVANTVFSRIDNAGRVIADGGTLDLSGYTGGLTNTTDNTTGSNGWFAVNQGKLALPTLTLSGATAVNWGEAAADTSIDLVNSARLTFGAAKSGTLTGSLLATDRADVAAQPPAGYVFLSVHEFSSSFTVGSCNLAIRYDPSGLAALRIDETSLKIRQYTGGAWVDVTSSLDTGNKVITSSAVSALGQFAVTGRLPTAGTAFSFR